MPKPPVDGDYFDKVNFVIDSWMIGCNAPWYVYIELMKEPALKAILTLLTFGWDDIARGYYRPRDRHRRRSSKRKRRWAKHRPRFPELGETIGQNLPGAQEQKGKRWSWGGRTLWRIDTVMQQWLFYWLVVDVTVEFVFDWTSLLYESYWCQEDPPGRFSYSLPGLFGKSSGVWWKTAYAVLDYQDAPPSWSYRTGNSGPNGCTCVATCTWEKWGSFPQPTETGIRLYDKDTGEIFDQSGPGAAQITGPTTMVSKGNIPPNTRFGVAVYHQPSWALVGEGAVAAVETVSQ